MTDAGGSGPPPAGSTSEQLLRVTLEKNTKPDLIEKCKAAGISEYTKKRKEELIDLLVSKKPRLDVAKEESTGNEEASVRLRFFFVRAMKLCAISMQRCLSMPLCVCLDPFPAIDYIWLSASMHTLGCDCDEPHRTLGQTMRTPLTRPTTLGMAVKLSSCSRRSCRTSSQCGTHWPKRTGSPVPCRASCRNRVNPSEDHPMWQSTSRSKMPEGSFLLRFSRT